MPEQQKPIEGKAKVTKNLEERFSLDISRLSTDEVAKLRAKLKDFAADLRGGVLKDSITVLNGHSSHADNDGWI